MIAIIWLDPKVILSLVLVVLMLKSLGEHQSSLVLHSAQFVIIKIL